MLQEELNTLVERLQEVNVTTLYQTLEQLSNHIRASTTSMTSVPKPLKFMRPHYDTMKDIYEKIIDIKSKQLCSDIISVLAMTMNESRECLKYRLTGSSMEVGEWGHEYVRHLSGELSAEWDELAGDEGRAPSKELTALVHEIVPYNMAHNGEVEACDLLMEIEKLEFLLQYVDESAYPRVCNYLNSCVQFAADPENTTLLSVASKLYIKFGQYPLAVRMAMQLNDQSLINDIFLSCKDM